MNLITGGLGLGALVTGGLGLGPDVVPPTPPAPPYEQRWPQGTPGGGGGEPQPGDIEFNDVIISGEVIAEETEWVYECRQFAERWARFQAGRSTEHGSTTGGGVDAGLLGETWAVPPAGGFVTAGATDAGLLRETWEVPGTVGEVTGGGKDAGVVLASWEDDTLDQ